MKKFLDARGLACPQPLILTKKILGDPACDAVEIKVDTSAAKENVTRFLTKQGFSSITVEQHEGIYIISTEGAPGGLSPVQDRAVNKVIFLATDHIGSGDRGLGNILMRGFIYSLNEMHISDADIILMNSGVKLACTGSEAIDGLRQLEEAGCTIHVCGTCLDFFHLEKQLACGIVSNMFDITQLLIDNGQTTYIS
jgi:selenium metabolism protein YedF